MEEKLTTPYIKNNYTGIILTMFLVALIAGSIVYIGQKSIFDQKIQEQAQRAQKEQEKLQEEITALQNQMAQLQVQEKETATEEEQPIITELALGYIKMIYEQNGKRYLNIDYIQWLSHSNKTCFVLGSELPNVPQCNPNGFLIVNQNPKIRTFEISKGAEIQMVTGAGAEINTYEEFKSLFAAESTSHLKNIPYHIEVRNGVIVKIIEQYIP